MLVKRTPNLPKISTLPIPVSISFPVCLDTALEGFLEEFAASLKLVISFFYINYG
jgi:hypothetical protein